MRGPRGPRKTLKAAQTVIIGIPEPMLQVIVCNTEPLCQQALILLQIVQIGWIFPEIKQTQTDPSCA